MFKPKPRKGGTYKLSAAWPEMIGRIRDVAGKNYLSVNMRYSRGTLQNKWEQLNVSHNSTRSKVPGSLQLQGSAPVHLGEKVDG